jgi:hypothetical protein
MDAQALVPSPYEDEETGPAVPDETRWASIDLDEFVSKVIVPGDDQQESISNTFQGLVSFYATKYSTEDDVKDITVGAMASLKEIQHLKDEASKTSAKGSSLISRLIKKGLIRIVKWLLKKAIGTIVRFATWAFRRIVIGGIEGLLEWVVRPVLMEVLGFIGLNPELWPVIAAIGGVAALGYGAYKMFFQDKGSNDVKDLSDDEREDLQDQQSATATANRLTDQSPYTGAAYPRAANAPQVAGPPATSLEALISRGEGSYNSVNRGAAHGYRAGTEDLAHMTVAQVMAHQEAQDFNAVGRYQMIKGTLASAVKALGINGSELFTPQLQDRIFEDYLIGQKRHQIADYISGKSDDLNAAVLAASQEWASVAAPAGSRLYHGQTGDGFMSYYAGTANNRASISAQEMAATLQAERQKRLGATNATAVASTSKVVPGTTMTSVTNAQKAQVQAQTNPTSLAGPTSDGGTIIKQGRTLVKVAA